MALFSDHDDIVDYYAILGVESDATENTISKAFKKLAVKIHPDKNPDDATAADRFREASKARDILLDSKSRAEFDSKWKAREQQKQRYKHLDEKRRRMRDALEKREREAATAFRSTEPIFGASGGINATKSADAREAERLDKIREQTRREREEMAKSLHKKAQQATARGRDSVQNETSTPTPTSSHSSTLDTAIRVQWTRATVEAYQRNSESTTTLPTDPQKGSTDPQKGSTDPQKESTISDNDLKTIFGPFGKITAILKKKSKSAYIVFENQPSMAAALCNAPPGFNVTRIETNKSGSTSSSRTPATSDADINRKIYTKNLFSPLKVQATHSRSTPTSKTPVSSQKARIPFITPITGKKRVSVNSISSNKSQKSQSLADKEAETLAMLMQASKKRKPQA